MTTLHDSNDPAHADCEACRLFAPPATTYYDHLQGCLECLNDPLRHRCAMGQRLYLLEAQPASTPETVPEGQQDADRATSACPYCNGLLSLGECQVQRRVAERKSVKTLLCGCTEHRPCAEHRPIESKLTAEEKMLFQAVLEVVDNGSPKNIMRRWYLWSDSESAANEERLAFADAIIDRFREVKRND